MSKFKSDFKCKLVKGKEYTLFFFHIIKKYNIGRLRLFTTGINDLMAPISYGN